MFRDPKKYPDMADHLLNKQFPEKDLNQAVAIAAMCLQEEASVRPFMSDVVTTLSFLSTSPPPPGATPAPIPADTNQDGNSECVTDNDESSGEASDNESTRSSDDNRRHCTNDSSDKDGSNDRNLRQLSGEGSKEWHSFERDENTSPGDLRSKSKSNKSGRDTILSQDKYGSATSRSHSQESNEAGTSQSNNGVTQKEETTVTVGEIKSAESSNGNTKSVNFLDRTTSRRAP